MDADLKRDTAVLALFGAAFLLLLFVLTSALLFASLGVQFLWLVKASMGATAAFAVVACGFGLKRAARSLHPLRTF